MLDLKRKATNGSKTLRVQKLSATTGVNLSAKFFKSWFFRIITILDYNIGVVWDILLWYFVKKNVFTVSFFHLFLPLESVITRNVEKTYMYNFKLGYESYDMEFQNLIDRNFGKIYRITWYCKNLKL
jgi:hypothetical protein